MGKQTISVLPHRDVCGEGSAHRYRPSKCLFCKCDNFGAWPKMNEEKIPNKWAGPGSRHVGLMWATFGAYGSVKARQVTSWA